MSEQRPTLSLRYYLNLDESQDGFALVTFGKKTITRFLTPVISIAVILWGFYLGLTGVGRYYVALGVFFLLMQGLMRYWLLHCCLNDNLFVTSLAKVNRELIYIKTNLSFTQQGKSKQYNTQRFNLLRLES